METVTEIQTQALHRTSIVPIVTKVLKAVANVLFFLLMALVAMMLYFLIQSRANGGAPKIAGNYALVVLSGSMSPQFDMGSVILVKPVEAEEIKMGDIITFKGFAGSEELTTHRVVGIHQKTDGPEFITKGDANRTDDPDPVPAKNFIGRVSLSIPYLGYFMNFSQTKYGLLLLIVVPGALLILSECRNLYTSVSAAKKRKQEETPQKEEATPAGGKEEP